MSLIYYLKSRVRRYRILEFVLFFIYTRFTFTYRTIQAKFVNVLIKTIKKAIIKKEICGIYIVGDSTILELEDGRKFYWDTPDRMSLLGMGLTGVWEHDDTEYLKKVVKRGDVAIDIGANYGFHTILFSKLVGERGKVYSFEPLKSMFGELQKNISLNSSQENTVLANCALGEKLGYVKIYVPKIMGRGASALVARGTTVEQETVEIITLDSYVSRMKIKKVDFIKCDIEGAELLAFQGTIKVLKKYRPTLMFEITRGSSEAFGYTPEILLDFLGGFGYEFYYVAEARLLKIKPASIPYFHGNCFAFPK